MSQIQAIFFDIDGTLVPFKSNKIEESTLKAIQKAKENGYKIALATSRPLSIINDIENVWNIHWDGIVAGSGTMIYDEKREVFKDHMLSKDTLRKIFQIANDYDIAIYTCGDQSFFTKWNDLTKWLKSTYHVSTNQVHPYNGEAVQLITLLSSNRKELYSIFHNINGIRLVKGGPYNSDIFPTHINKCTGIHELMEKWGLNQQNYMCFGDTQGDYEMIMDSNIGIVMASGMKETKEIADYVCQDIEDGLSHFKII